VELVLLCPRDIKTTAFFYGTEQFIPKTRFFSFLEMFETAALSGF